MFESMLDSSSKGGKKGKSGAKGAKGAGKNGGVNLAVLTTTIKNAATIEELLNSFSKNERHLDHIHLSACWSALGNLVSKDSWKDGNSKNGWLSTHEKSVDALSKCTTKTISSNPKIRGRQLANIAHGLAKTGVKSGKVSGENGIPTSINTLLTTISKSLRERHLQDCNAQETANLAWGFAKTGHQDAELFKAIARSSEQFLDNFNSQELANLAWAFATLGHPDPSLFKALARVVEQWIDDFNTQGLANTAWAFAKINHVDAQLFKVIAEKTRVKLDHFNAQDFSNTAWAFAKLAQYDAALFSAFARHIDWHLGEFNIQGLANTVWAFAKVGHLDAKVFTALAGAVQKRVSGFNSQDLANTSWAFAKACHLDKHLFEALARAVEERLNNVANKSVGGNVSGRTASVSIAPEFNPQDLVNTAWSFAKMTHFDTKLFIAIGKSTMGRVEELSTTHIANVAWAFAKAGNANKAGELSSSSEAGKNTGSEELSSVDTRLFLALARSTERRVAEFTASELGNVAWAFANAGRLDEQLFDSLAIRAQIFLNDFSEEELDNAEWAFSKAGQHKIAKSLRQKRKEAKGVDANVDDENHDATKDDTASKNSGKCLNASKCGKIVIAGGGIGGSAAAVALRNKGFDVMVLETDRSFDARKQGYGLTIQGYGLTTQKLGIGLGQDDAPSTSHYMFNAEGNILGFYGEAFGSKSKKRKETDDSGRFVHIPRQMLRQRILEKIPEGVIRWNSRLAKYKCWNEKGADSDESGSESESEYDDSTTDESEKAHRRARKERKLQRQEASENPEKNGVTVTLTDGTEIDASLLIGCDGIFSRVRQQLSLPGDRLNYVGLIVVLGILPTTGLFDPVKNTNTSVDESLKHVEPMSVPLAERRIFETMDGETRIYAMPFTTTSTMWQMSFPYDEMEARKLVKDSATLKAEILKRISNWHKPVPEMIENTPLDCMSGYPVYDRELLDPNVLRTAKNMNSRVTLMGDAAHPMTPFRAQGANQALSDAVLLADTLSEFVDTFGPHGGMTNFMPIFEKKMLSRSGRMVTGSRQKAKELHSNLALQQGRKVQRTHDRGGVDMQQAIKILQKKGVGAMDATNTKGLDAVVCEAIGWGSSSPSSCMKKECPKVRKRAKEKTAIDKKRSSAEVSSNASDSTTEPQQKKRKTEKVESELPRPVVEKVKKVDCAVVAEKSETVEGEDKQDKIVERKTRKVRLMYGLVDGDWQECVLLKTTKDNKNKIRWNDGKTAVLESDKLKARTKKVVRKKKS